MNDDVWKIYRFCPRCGSPLAVQTGDDGPLLRCTVDGFVFYQNPHSAVAVVIINDAGQFLFVRRQVAPHQGDWDLPGGFVNWGEAPATAIVREVHEELGVDLSITKILDVAHDWYNFNGLNYSVNSIIFQGSISGTIVQNEEIKSLHWLSRRELPDDHLSFQSVRKAVHLLRQ